jgi:hypothetical protein
LAGTFTENSFKPAITGLKNENKNDERLIYITYFFGLICFKKSHRDTAASPPTTPEIYSGNARLKKERQIKPTARLTRLDGCLTGFQRAIFSENN